MDGIERAGKQSSYHAFSNFYIGAQNICPNEKSRNIAFAFTPKSLQGFRQQRPFRFLQIRIVFE
jgi:hypothetical protein